MSDPERIESYGITAVKCASTPTGSVYNLYDREFYIGRVYSSDESNVLDTIRLVAAAEQRGYSKGYAAAKKRIQSVL